MRRGYGFYATKTIQFAIFDPFDDQQALEDFLNNHTIIEWKEVKQKIDNTEMVRILIKYATSN